MSASIHSQNQTEDAQAKAFYTKLYGPPPQGMSSSDMKKIIGTAYLFNKTPDQTVNLDNCAKMFKNTNEWLSDKNANFTRECKPILISTGVMEPPRKLAPEKYKKVPLVAGPSILPKSRYNSEDLKLNGSGRRRKTRRTNRRKRRSTRKSRA